MELLGDPSQCFLVIRYSRMNDTVFRNGAQQYNKPGSDSGRRCGLTCLLAAVSLAGRRWLLWSLSRLVYLFLLQSTSSHRLRFESVDVTGTKRIADVVFVNVQVN